MSRQAWALGTTAAAAFFVLCGYEFLRSPSATLFQAAYGVRKLPLAMAMIPVAMLAAIWVYNRLLSRLGPRKTLAATTTLSFLILALSVLGVWLEIRFATAVLYVFREVYIVLLVEQYWSFFNSTLEESRARKVSGILTGIGSIGAILGGVMVHQFSEPLGTKMMPLIGIALMGFPLLCADLGYRRCGEPAPTITEKVHEDHALGLQTLRSTPVLMFLFMLVLTTQLVSTVLGLSFQHELQNTFKAIDKQTAYSGSFYAWLNAASLLFQAIGTPVALRFIRPIFIQLSIPLIHACAALYLFLHPSMTSAATAFLLFKSLDYSLFRSSKEILYMPLSFDARYRAKELIDVFGYRFSKGATSIGIVILQKMMPLAQGFYSGLALLGCIAWMGIAIPLTLTKSKHNHNDR